MSRRPPKGSPPTPEDKHLRVEACSGTGGSSVQIGHSRPIFWLGWGEGEQVQEKGESRKEEELEGKV